MTAGETGISSHTISSLLLTNKGCHCAQTQFLHKSRKELPYSDQHKIYSDIMLQHCYKYYHPDRRVNMPIEDLQLYNSSPSIISLFVLDLNNSHYNEKVKGFFSFWVCNFSYVLNILTPFQDMKLLGYYSESP